MKSVTAPSFDLWALVDPTPEFQIAIIFDGHAQGLQAMRLCRRLITQFNDDFLFRVAVCPLNTFTGSGTKTAAQRQAERASVIILATGTPPPPWFWTWLDAWACAQVTRPAAIVPLATAGPENDAQLRHLCSARDIALIISNTGSGGEEQPPPELKNAPHDDTQLATIVHHMANAHPVQNACLSPKV